MDPVISRLSQFATRCGVLLMLGAGAAYLVSGDPIVLLTPAMLIAFIQLLCLVEGPWTASLQRRFALRARRGR